MDRLRLPNANAAIVAVEKLRDYALDPDHPRGRHKARVFSSALGIEQSDWSYLRAQILDRLQDAAVTSVRETAHGFLYEVPVEVEGLNGASVEVLTAWLRPGRDAPPQLVSAYVNRP